MEIAEKIGTTRTMDDLGRVIIPSDIREALGWEAGTRLEVSINDISVKSIIIREAAPRCSLCRKESNELKKVEKGYICPDCAVQLR